MSVTTEFPVAVVTADQVNIGRKIKFAPAQFTHGDNIQFHWIAVRFQRLSVFCRELLLAGVKGFPDQLIGQVA